MVPPGCVAAAVQARAAPRRDCRARAAPDAVALTQWTRIAGMKPHVVARVLLLAPSVALAASSAPHDVQPKPKYPEPVVHERVTQDRAVRIRERQVRGATTSIKVQPLHGGPAYRVVPPDAAAGNDPAHMQGKAQWTIGVFK